MLLVAIINQEQREFLRNKLIDGITYFNVDSLDLDGNYIIGVEEINACTNEACMFIKALELTEYKRPIEEI